MVVVEGTFALMVALHWSPVSLECNTVNVSYNQESLGPRKAKTTLTNICLIMEEILKKKDLCCCISIDERSPWLPCD